MGHPGPEPPRRPVLSQGGQVLVTLAVLAPDGRPTWHGLWVAAGRIHPLGPAVPPSSLPARASAPEAARLLIDLLAAASRSLLERLEEVGRRLDVLEASSLPAPLGELASLQRALGAVRKHLFRLDLLLAELDGPLGARFPGTAEARVELAGGITRTGELAAGLQQAARDLLGLRTAQEANRLAEAANALGQASNRISATANASNLRMLGVAYVALALALVSAVVLIPNTAATILGMPSASWVPGLWVDVILLALAVVPAAVVFSRPWVRKMLAGWAGYERRSSEGLADLPELPADGGTAAATDERLRDPRP